MKYDFESILDRAGKDAIAVDLPTNQAGAFKDVKRKEGFDETVEKVSVVNEI